MSEGAQKAIVARLLDERGEPESSDLIVTLKAGNIRMECLYADVKDNAKKTKVGDLLD